MVRLPWEQCRVNIIFSHCNSNNHCAANSIVNLRGIMCKKSTIKNVLEKDCFCEVMSAQIICVFNSVKDCQVSQITETINQFN